MLCITERVQSRQSSEMRWNIHIWHLASTLVGLYKVQLDLIIKLMQAICHRTFNLRTDLRSWQCSMICRFSFQNPSTTLCLWRLVTRSARLMLLRSTCSLASHRTSKIQLESIPLTWALTIRRQSTSRRTIRSEIWSSWQSMKQSISKVSKTKVSTTCSHLIVILWDYNSTSKSSTPSSGRPSRAMYKESGNKPTKT